MKKHLFQELDSVQLKTSYRDWMFELEEVIRLFNRRNGTQYDTVEILTEYLNH